MNTKSQFILAFRAFRSDVEVHKHAAFQIVISEDEPFDTFSEEINHKKIYGFAIKPQVAHACSCSNSNLIILNIEPYSEAGKNLLTRFEASQNVILFYSQKEISDFFNTSSSPVSIQLILKSLLSKGPVPEKNTRITTVLDFIHSEFNSNKFSLDDIAERVCLSPSRLGLVFKRQTGSSIFKYLLWTRLRFAISQLLTDNKKNITEIALESGFYDSSQMNKFMYEMIGISPSRLKQKSDLIQLLD